MSDLVHTQVLKQICNYIVVVMRDWYTSAERKDLHERWAKAARTKSPADIAMAACRRVFILWSAK